MLDPFEQPCVIFLYHYRHKSLGWVGLNHFREFSFGFFAGLFPSRIEGPRYLAEDYRKWIGNIWSAKKLLRTSWFFALRGIFYQLWQLLQ